MDALTKLLILWTAFISTHMLLSSNWLRPRLVRSMGQTSFLVVYSLIALLIIVPLFATYMANKHQGPVLWSFPHEPWLVAGVSAGNVVALILFAAGFLTPSPVVRAMPFRGPRGANYISRHCLMMGFALWALMHLIVNGFATDVVFFGGFAVFALAGAAHQDRRKLSSGDPAFAAFHAATPFFPFTGKHTMRGLREFSILAVIAGVMLAALIRGFHQELFG